MCAESPETLGPRIAARLAGARAPASGEDLLQTLRGEGSVCTVHFDAALRRLSRDGAVVTAGRGGPLPPALDPSEMRRIPLAVGTPSAAGAVRVLGDRWRVHLNRPLGQGSFARVYRAEHAFTGRAAAAKILRPDLSDLAVSSDEIRERFEREVRILGKLTHPHVVQVLDGGAEGGEYWYVMELVEGGMTLARKIAEKAVAAPVEWMRQVASALQAAAEQGVVHRDVKPSNILIDEQGRARLADFGLAKVHPHPGLSETVRELTRPRALVGSIAYMAPEVRELRPAGPASDVYSLGAAFFEAAAGRRFLDHPEDAPIDLPSPFPTRFARLLERMLALRPEDRPTYPALLKELTRVGEELHVASATIAIGASSAQPPEDRVGGTIGSYRLEELLGAGGSGAVYRARDALLEREVAIKILHPRYAADPGFEDRFLREARNAAKLDHPHVVTVHGAGRHGDLLWIAMQYVRGRTLRQVLDERKRLPAEEALRLVRQVTEALDAAHRLDLVHRDIKPSNILVDEDARAKLADFGLMRSTRLEQDLTETGAFSGTPAYASPEQARGETKTLDIRTDIYSLGAVLYELLSGTRPYSAESPLAVLRRIGDLHDRPAPIRRLVPDLAPEVEAIVDRMTAKRTEDRFAAPREVLRALERATVPKSGASSGKLIGVGVATVLLLAGLAGLKALTSGPTPEPPSSAAKPSVEPEKPREKPPEPEPKPEPKPEQKPAQPTPVAWSEHQPTEAELTLVRAILTLGRETLTERREGRFSRARLEKLETTPWTLPLVEAEKARWDAAEKGEKDVLGLAGAGQPGAALLRLREPFEESFRPHLPGIVDQAIEEAILAAEAGDFRLVAAFPDSVPLLPPFLPLLKERLDEVRLYRAKDFAGLVTAAPQSRMARQIPTALRKALAHQLVSELELYNKWMPRPPRLKVWKQDPPTYVLRPTPENPEGVWLERKFLGAREGYEIDFGYGSDGTATTTFRVLLTPTQWLDLSKAAASLCRRSEAGDSEEVLRHMRPVSRVSVYPLGGTVAVFLDDQLLPLPAAEYPLLDGLRIGAWGGGSVEVRSVLVKENN